MIAHPGNRRKPYSTFSSNAKFIRPSPPPQATKVEEYSDDEYEEPIIITPKKSKQKRLPGVRLLRQLAKERQREAQKKKDLESHIDERVEKKLASRVRLALSIEDLEDSDTEELSE